MRFHENKLLLRTKRRDFYQFTVVLVLIALLNSCRKDVPVAGITAENFKVKLENVYDEVVLEEKYDYIEDLELYVVTNNVSFEDDYYRGVYLFLLSVKYYNLSSYSLAISNAKEAITLFEKIPGSEVKISQCLSVIGISAFQDNSDFSITKNYLNKAINMAAEAECDRCLLLYYFNFSNICKYSEDLMDSKRYALKVIELVNKLNTKHNFLKFMHLNVAAQEIEAKNYDIALFHLGKTSENYSTTSLLLGKNLHAMYAQVYAETGEPEKATASFLKAMEYDKKLTVQTIQKENEAITASANLNFQINKYKTSLVNNQRILIILTIVVLLAGLITILLISRQKRDIRLKSKEVSKLNQELKRNIQNEQRINRELERKTAEVNKLLELKQKTLVTKELQLSTMRDNLQKVSVQIDDLCSLKSIPPNKLLYIDKTVSSLISDEKEVWEDLKVQFEQLRPGFFKNLNARCTNLSVNDLKHCAYIVSNLSSKEVAGLINISPRSVETTRYRIKKKLNLKSDKNLYEFLQQI